jgi:hypothetical protein
MADNPQFIKTPVIGSVNLTAANTALDGTGTITTLTQGATGGSRVVEIVVKSAATSAAAQIGLFTSTDSGTTWRLFDQIAVTAVSVSNTVASFRASRSYSNLCLADATHRIGVTSTIAQSVNVQALGGHFV